jgi:gliding motility-associated-like protein
MYSLLVTFSSIIFLKCDKDKKEPIHVHCDNLINETVGPSDNAEISVATAFTPNSDGLNDAFHPITQGLQSVSIKVYDENSNLVFSSSQMNAAWLPATSGQKKVKYYYRVEAVTQTQKNIGVCGEVVALQCLPANTPVGAYSFEDQYSGSGFTLPTSEVLPVCN